jgi:predicted porin
MKKSLFAIAAVTAFAGAAQAQSSVTVYGLLDYGFGGSSQTAAGPQASNTGSNNAGTALGANSVLKTQTSGFGGNGESTSRIGFRGTEDLGGGVRAFFTAEAALNTDAASAGIFSTAGTSNRQTFIGLSKKGLGAASVGIQYTPVHEAAAATDAGGLNNQNGNVIYDRSGGWGANTGQTLGGTGNIGQAASGMATNTSYTIRSTNMLMLKSERVAGFMGKVMVVAGGKDVGGSSNLPAASSSNLSTDTQGYGGSIDYTWKKLFVTANYQQFTNNTTQIGVSRTYAPGYNGAGIAPGVNSQDSQQYYAATYDFGILKAYAQYVNRKVQNVNNDANYIQRSAQQIGVRAPITKTVTAWASAGTGKMNNTGAGAVTANINGWQLGSDYNLSKRTNLYAIYGQTSTSNAATGGYGSLTTPAANSQPTSYNASSYAVGVRHTF